MRGTILLYDLMPVPYIIVCWCLSELNFHNIKTQLIIYFDYLPM